MDLNVESMKRLNEFMNRMFVHWRTSTDKSLADDDLILKTIAIWYFREEKGSQTLISNDVKLVVRWSLILYSTRKAYFSKV